MNLEAVTVPDPQGDPTWEAGPPRPGLDQGDLHLWLFLHDTAGGPDDEALLDAPERARRDQFYNDGVRRRFIAGRAGLRRVLARYLDRAPGEVRFTAGDHGKPELADAGTTLRFNVAHTSDRTVVAIASDLEVGVDVEMNRSISDPIMIARRHFDPGEISALEHRSGDRALAFLMIWTAKEAVLKGTGRGVGGGLRFPLIELPDPLAPTRLSARLPAPLGRDSWDVRWVSIGSWVCAVATDRPANRLFGWTLQAESSSMATDRAS